MPNQTAEGILSSRGFQFPRTCHFQRAICSTGDLQLILLLSGASQSKMRMSKKIMGWSAEFSFHRNPINIASALGGGLRSGWRMRRELGASLQRASVSATFWRGLRTPEPRASYSRLTRDWPATCPQALRRGWSIDFLSVKTLSRNESDAYVIEITGRIEMLCPVCLECEQVCRLEFHTQ